MCIPVVGGHRIMYVDTAPFTTNMQHAPSDGPKIELPRLSYLPPYSSLIQWHCKTCTGRDLGTLQCPI